MILFAFAVLLAIVIGGLLGTLLVRDPGYVLITYGDQALETSLWFALLVLLGAYVLFRALVYLVRRLARTQGEVVRWRSSRRVRNARQQTVRGLLALAEGRWADGKKQLLGAAPHVETPLINYLNSARACHELGQVEDRDRYLRLAHESTPGAKFATTLTQAEFQIRDGRYEQALAALLNLRKRAPRHAAVLAMLARCYEALGDWQALRAELTELADQKAVSEAELKRLTRLVWMSLLSGDENVAALWKKMPRWVKNDIELLRGWVASLEEAARGNDAEQAIRLILGQYWDDVLVRTYGEVRSDDVARQLLVAQEWSKERPNDSDLSMTLGRLCLMNEQFEQAREYFEAALRLEPSDEVYGELGRLCVALGDERRGTDYLLRSLGQLPSLPQPSSPVIHKAQVS